MAEAGANPSASDGTPTIEGAPAASAALPPSQAKNGRSDPSSDVVPESIRDLLPATLSRLAAGLPMHELDIIIKEATACEDALEREIEILERELGVDNPSQPKQDDNGQRSEKEPPAPSSPLKEPTMISIPLLPPPYQPGGEPGKGHVNYLDSVDAMLHTEFAPPDRYFTVSALLGRLRDPMKLPYPPNSRLAAARGAAANKGNKKGDSPEQGERKRRLALEKQRALLVLETNEVYNREHPDTKELLTLYKKISAHRTAAVFRKPVNPAEAPGYKERILFPMDLSLIRKMIVARMIKSFSSLHQRIGLICHNCVKFNGRESDYAVLTRDFEDFVDDKVLEAVKNAAKSAKVAASDTPVANAAAGSVVAV